jgi:hypothetical protein
METFALFYYFVFPTLIFFTGCEKRKRSTQTTAKQEDEGGFDKFVYNAFGALAMEIEFANVKLFLFCYCKREEKKFSFFTSASNEKHFILCFPTLLINKLSCRLKYRKAFHETFSSFSHEYFFPLVVE